MTKPTKDESISGILRELTDEIIALRVSVDRMVEDVATREVRIKLVVDE